MAGERGVRPIPLAGSSSIPRFPSHTVPPGGRPNRPSSCLEALAFQKPGIPCGDRAGHGAGKVFTPRRHDASHARSMVPIRHPRPRACSMTRLDAWRIKGFGNNPDPRVRSFFEFPVLASRCADGAWPQHDLFVSSCDQKQRLVRRSHASGRGDFSHEDTKTRRRQARGRSSEDPYSCATRACWPDACRNSPACGSQASQLPTRGFGKQQGALPSPGKPPPRHAHPSCPAKLPFVGRNAPCARFHARRRRGSRAMSA